MEEAQKGTAILEDVDEDTFALFAQFVYTGRLHPVIFQHGEGYSRSCRTIELRFWN